MALFSGAVWTPTYPYTTELSNLVGGRKLDFGVNPLPTGLYMFILTVELGWNAGGATANNKNGNAWLKDGTTNVFEITHARLKTGTSGFGYGVSQGVTYQFKGEITNGNNLYLEAGLADMYLLGATLSVWKLPNYYVESPGFIS